MGKGKQRMRQEDMWIAHTQLAAAPAPPFYRQWNRLLEENGFDQFVEGCCAKFYESGNGRLSLTPGIYFRSLMIGYFEGIDSERGMAWRFGGNGLALWRLSAEEFCRDGVG